MSVLPESITRLPDFLDYRQDQFNDVISAIDTLKSINVDDPDEMIRTITELDLPRVHRMYHNKWHDMRNGNNTLLRALLNVSFRPFKAVLGADDYV